LLVCQRSHTKITKDNAQEQTDADRCTPNFLSTTVSHQLNGGIIPTPAAALNSSSNNNSIGSGDDNYFCISFVVTRKRLIVFQVRLRLFLT